MTAGRTVLPKGRLRAVERLLAERCGLHYGEEDRAALGEVVSRRMTAGGFDSVSAYRRHLEDARSGASEFQTLLDLLAVPHTYFFRNDGHIRALREHVIPHLLDAARQRGEDPPRLRVWSAGCSTGEEPYSISMLLHEAAGEGGARAVDVCATDVRAAALGAARRAEYGERSLRLVDAARRRRWFTDLGGRYRVRDEIRTHVRFGRLNLVRDPYPAGCHLILCRNVLIYLRPEAIREIVGRLYESLRPGGYLFLGWSEGHRFLGSRFQAMTRHGTVFYRRAGDGKGLDRPTEPEVPPGGHGAALEEIVSGIRRSMECKEYDRARTLISQALRIDPGAEEPALRAAEIDANLGRADEAKAGLEALLARNRLYAPAHLLLASIHHRAGDLGAARASLRGALYLDPDLSMAHFLFGIVNREEGRSEDAIREFRNAIRSVGRQAPGQAVPFGGGFSARGLAGICRDCIEQLEEAE